MAAKRQTATTNPLAAPMKAKKTLDDTIVISQEPAPTRQQPFADHSESSSGPSDDDDSTCPTPTPAPSSIGQMLKRAIEMLRTMRVKTENATIREAVINMLQDHVEGDKQTLPMQQNHKENDRITSMERDLKEIKEALKSIATKSPRSYAEAVTSPNKLENTRTQVRLDTAQRERLEQARSERAKAEVTLTFRNASEKACTQLRDTSEKDYAASLQTTIHGSNAKGVIIRKLQKLPGKLVKIQFANENDAGKLRELDWEKSFEGASIVKQEYGIVLHGVPVEVIDARNATQKQAKELIKSANTIKIERIAPLTKNPRNPDAPTQSIVIFTGCPKDANDAILDNIRIEGRYYQAKRYNPQHQIRQCFRCQGYGHKAVTCTRELACGRCAQEHETKSCTQEENKCSHCSGSHPAWHHKCPKHIKEHERLEELIAATPMLFQC